MKLRRIIGTTTRRVKWLTAATTTGRVREVSDGFIRGAISASAAARHGVDRVELHINDMCVMTAVIGNAGRNRNFEFGVYDFWRFAQRRDQVTVRYAGRALAMPSGDVVQRPHRNGKEDLQSLRQRLERGQGFDGQGKIYLPSKDEDTYWQAGVLELYAKVDEVIYEVTGSRSFIYSGTLLGYVRENGFIPHDKDMDCAYVSSMGEAPSVAREFETLGSRLIDRGFHVTPKASCISVRERGGSRIMVDIAHLFVKSEGTIGFPFGTVGTEEVPPSDFLPVDRGSLGGFDVGIPAKPEDVVAHIYGTGWRVPDPQFKWTTERRRRDPQALLSYSQRSRLAMDDHYAHGSSEKPSDFSSWVVGQAAVQSCRSVIDIGCGNGRDDLTLAESSRHVLAVDRSRTAIDAARVLLKNHESVSVLELDVLEAGRLTELAESCRTTAPGPVLFYLRFVLNGLTAVEESTLFDELQHAVKVGDYVAIEHRTAADEGRRKAFFRSFRRFIAAEETADRLGKAGFRVELSETGTGKAQFGREDPEVVRFLARRS